MLNSIKTKLKQISLWILLNIVAPATIAVALTVGSIALKTILEWYGIL